MTDREASAARLAETLEGAPVDYQISTLELLGRMGGKTALNNVASAAESDNPEIKDAATRVLGEWPDAEAASVLLEIARSDPENRYQIRALRGYLRIARQLQLPPETRLEMFHTAMEVAGRDNERRLALDILSRIPSAATLELAVSSLDKPGLRDAAADAATKIAARLLESEPKAVAVAMQKVVDSGAEGQPGARGRQLLNQAQSRLR
jgi:HEAT repeat protein